jgi:murein DD-endopeptidase MepM/ murein hydrolase activator NlpD
MVAETPSRGRGLFPEICISFRTGTRASQFFLPPGLQIAAILTVIVAVVAVSCFTDIEKAADRAKNANAGLRREITSLQHRLAIAIRERGQLEERLSDLAYQAASLSRFLATAGASRRLQELAEPFHQVGLITTETDQMEADPPRPPVVISDMVISDSPVDAEHESLGEIVSRAIGELRRLLASTGLNVERLFPQLGPNRPVGGPFVPPPKGDQPAPTSPDKLEAIRSLIKSLPLSTPLDFYQLESRFGPRHDPFNHRASFHTGIDLSAPYMSPVYATAAGVVIYAGYYSDYGKVVEIDHGNGIATLYAHLHRFTVSLGQKVAEHDQIGFLGSTGRSSGPHVHYEVRVNDEPQDPEKFIGLARVIPAAER